MFIFLLFSFFIGGATYSNQMHFDKCVKSDYALEKCEWVQKWCEQDFTKCKKQEL